MPKPASQVIQEFEELINMDHEELEQWLTTEKSQSVGWKGDSEGSDSESVGHSSGRHIVHILQKKQRYEDYDEEDIQHMRRVVSYCKRHLAQRHRLKNEKVEDSTWRASLMNWGHDPLKDAIAEDDEQ